MSQATTTATLSGAETDIGTYDYIIVGAGSAGCVLANRLTADPSIRVLLLEAGGKDTSPLIHIPVGYAETLKDPKVNWLYQTEADPGTNGRQHVWPRGKVLGGSSSINGLLYIRGQRRDYDIWRQLGCEGWGWDDCAPYFLKSQNQERAGLDGHATGGPLNVSDVTQKHPVSDAVIQAGVEIGIPRNDDPNGENQEGIGYYQLTVKNGMRCSAAVAYLHPIKQRPNLTIRTHALAHHVIFTGKRAIGVQFSVDGDLLVAKASHEVILSGGAINSPQLLQLSGIGPADLLRRHGIAVKVDLPGVGQNLRDHYVVGMRYRLKPGVKSVNEMTKGLTFVGEVLKFLFQRKGLLTLSAAHIAAFVKTRPELETPDVQYHILPATMDQKKLFDEQKMVLEDRPGLTIAPCQLRPESTGRIEIKSADPSQHAGIWPNYLADSLDQQTIVEGLKIGRRMAQAPALAGLIEAEMEPGSAVVSDEALLAYARETGSTIYHPVGTAKMGRDAMAVVDPSLKVIGVDGLRVVDASIMPRLISGNTNAPTIMIAEKASDMILAARGQSSQAA
ncbi:alcohol dehydrogenase [acceptor] [Candidatus Phycosocius bacilliformis]|uniref:Alcohol dehydrogenase [acceptor] n=1 Tax=Candidatus Phycosocius bacilliformis TaxID=1445552 RepID=A0A2P2EAX4_9PROT|nr:choline dehydrogenase [Candidatus Phycosocius bacilliformis]GBF58226.1 alcohol dehydrogenase [acceptor] [Candidatus Phycosocius bacilliformis]